MESSWSMLRSFTASRLLCLSAFGLLLLLCPSTTWKGCDAVDTASYESSSSSPSSTSSYSSYTPQFRVRRERNLDHWDSDTLAYYLDHHEGYDIVVMFYAQWDRNSHSLAPIYDHIATKLEAGMTSSRLIMALFDCEWDMQHTTLCNALDVTRYPTLLFVGSGPLYDTDPITRTIFGTKRSVGPMGSTSLSNGVKFQGNWQYVDSIVDWIRTMQALSNWHTWSTVGFGRRLRNFFIPHKTIVEPLPIGVPTSKGGNPMINAAKESAASGVGASSLNAGAEDGTGAASSATVAALEQRLAKSKEETELYEKAVVHASVMLDAALFPLFSSELEGTTADKKKKNDTKDKTKKTRPYTDLYAYLNTAKAWDQKGGTSPEVDILKACTLEISLDYCQRVATHEATDLVEELEASGKLASADTTQFEQDALKRMKDSEPYCGILEECIMNDMKDKACRPETCPFHDEAACRYLTSCLDPTLQQEYAKGLGYDTTTTTSNAATTTGTDSSGGSSSGGGSASNTGKWGL